MEGARAEAGRPVRRLLRKSRQRWAKKDSGGKEGARGSGFSSNSGSKISKVFDKLAERVKGRRFLAWEHKWTAFRRTQERQICTGENNDSSVEFKEHPGDG